MAIAKIAKIQIVGTSSNKDAILDILQNSGKIEIQDITEEKEELVSQKNNELHKVELQYANIDFAISLLSQHTKKKGIFAEPITLSVEEVKEKAKEFKYEKIINECYEIEEKTTKAKNQITINENELENYKAWKNLTIHLENLNGSNNISTILATVSTKDYSEIKEGIKNLSSLISIDLVKKDQQSTYLTIVFSKELEKEIRNILLKYKFTEPELPEAKGLLSKYCDQLEDEIKDNKKILKEEESKLKKLAKNLDELKITHDYISWEKERLEQENKLTNTDHSFVATGWAPKKSIPAIEEELNKTTQQYIINEIDLDEGEVPPVIIQNNKFLEPFEAVTNIYGLPQSHEIDPTPFLAAYFIVFFAMCLTDAGYGLLMFIVTALALKFIKMAPGMKKLVKLLMYGGIVTFIIGGLFGGWFGLTPDQVPESLTYTTDAGEKLFMFQKINSITDPLTVLILSLGIGFFQILMGTYMKLIHGIKESAKDAILDTGPWAFMLTGIGFGILAASGVISSDLGIIGKWWVISGAVLLVLTQGRKQKSIISKAISGILSLYNLIGYLSDVLSYARLLALGLATAIIGLAVNIIADLVLGIPYIGWLLMIIVFVGGHLFNLVINSLGSFIHSGRLQFVEFFGKFMEGGGKDFKPFSKKNKYVYIKNN